MVTKADIEKVVTEVFNAPLANGYRVTHLYQADTEENRKNLDKLFKDVQKSGTATYYGTDLIVGEK